MIRKNPSGDLPHIAESAYVDKTAIICGKVVIGENVFVGPYAVIRADEVDASGEMEPIIIGANSNIQDGVVIHSKSGAAVTIGEYSSIAHRFDRARPLRRRRSSVHRFQQCPVQLRRRQRLCGAAQLGGRRSGFAGRFLCALDDSHRPEHRPLAISTGERQRLGVF